MARDGGNWFHEWLSGISLLLPGLRVGCVRRLNGDKLLTGPVMVVVVGAADSRFQLGARLMKTATSPAAFVPRSLQWV